ncbi:hypothetical protein HS1genome_0596 [Sulfodiicoccus acidiphilus]|uniref:Uncharacterized protein n=2 Tax=Sulfodiicoccus acidiphilus TaxID=1670455 RepID=A0A348B205_9CREN|nr:hypothetical protein HS1genome_0596 [Sulfodiicoccus acidiphilus]GGU03040.1 hypothetical protein GCM10007116_20070 [Sulfodiicoccus acidiphilus]
MLELTPAFYVDDNLNQSVTVTVNVVQVTSTPAKLLLNGTTSMTFTLSPSEGEVPIYLTLLTYGTTPGQTPQFRITFTEVYS